MSMSIFFYGPPGVGKSTLGSALAETLKLHFVDLDERIASQAGMTISEIFSHEGQSGFRARETDALVQASAASSSVISLGGGALLSSHNRKLAESAGKVICLQANQRTLAKRLALAPGERPLLGDAQKALTPLLAERFEHYRSFALQITTDKRSLDDLLWHVQAALGHYYPQAMGNGYRVLIEGGSLHEFATQFLAGAQNSPLALVSDETVAALYAPQILAELERAGCEAQLVTFPAGEQYKNLATVTSLWDAFLTAKLERSSWVLALGGGVVSDMAGFAAATFLRGLPWGVLPTTLLSMVDASLGGKTGIDLPQGKNLVGAFYPPSFVLADPLTLETLPDIELRSGLAEVVKHGVIDDPALFELCAAGWDHVRSDWPRLIRHAAKVKIKFIEEDPHEHGRRAALNCGHTIGHAVESLSGYKIKHGQAIAIGMIAEAKLAQQLGLAESTLASQITSVLDGLGLPTKIPATMSRQDLIHIMQFDKKRAGKMLRFALPTAIGECKVGVEIPDLTARFLDLV